MPQMAPLNWLSLMIMFSMILISFNVLNYFNFQYQIKKTPSSKEKKMINWKW
uniref:ATP synthase complex subunit 8 n=1 Tax=Tenebrionoidea sp. 11 KM-2017 TaxID=2219466 RepID=A0A346RIH6_9CUCU|nr:ATP synthase F0 subunit 8 [Tenebrionoidea sp. 11 KM-2017]